MPLRSIRVSDAMAAALDQAASNQDASVNKIVQRAVSEHLGLDKVTSVRLPEQLVDQIDDLAASLDRSRGWLIEQACKLYLERTGGLPSVDWEVCDTSGSCGFTYRMDVTYNIPNVDDCDGVAYQLRDDTIHRLTVSGARDVYTSLTGVRMLQMENSATLPDEVSTEVDTECHHGRLECECHGPIIRVETVPPTRAIAKARRLTDKTWAIDGGDARTKWVWTGEIWQHAPCNGCTTTFSDPCTCLEDFEPCPQGHNPSKDLCALCPWSQATSGATRASAWQPTNVGVDPNREFSTATLEATEAPPTVVNYFISSANVDVEALTDEINARPGISDRT